MEIQDYIKKINAIKNALPERLHDSVYPEIAETTTRNLKNRIFSKGLDSNESEIGSYSEKPTTVTAKQFVKKASFTPTSNGGKSMKLKGGYKELKQIQSLKSEYVNLVYSGDLRKSVDFDIDNNGFTIGFTDKENAIKAKDLEDKYGKVIFQLSENERLKLNKNIASALRNIHKKMFYAD